MQTDNKKVIVICGPTASGKTEVSIELSKLIDIEIISADSRQIYKLLDIGTAKPTKNELEAVKHHFVDFLFPNEEYNAGKFGSDAYEIVNKIYENNKIPVIVGGAGLYIKALCEGFFDDTSIPEEIYKKIRKELSIELETKGIDELYNELKLVDNKSYILYNDKNPRRILRALEYYRVTGVAFSEAHKTNQIYRNILPYYFCILHPRDILYNRINDRVIKMIDMGLIEEVTNILNLGYDKTLNSLNTVGYAEIIKFLDGNLNLDETIIDIQKNTRRYAKRQLTWFNKIPNMNYISSKYKSYEIAEFILKEFIN